MFILLEEDLDAGEVPAELLMGGLGGSYDAIRSDKEAKTKNGNN